MVSEGVFDENALKTLCAVMANQDALPILAHSSSQTVSLSAAKALIIEAAGAYSSHIVQAAQTVLYDDERLHINTVEEGQAKIMYCAPAGMEGNKQAHIHLDYDQTIKGVVILAHELGHAIADDWGVNWGQGIVNNPLHMQETQAYMMQHIVTNYLMQHDDMNVRTSAVAQFGQGADAMLAISHEAEAAKDALEAIELGFPVIAQGIMDNVFGEGWDEIMNSTKNFHVQKIMQNTFEILDQIERAGGLEEQDMLRAELENRAQRLFDRPATYYAAMALVQKGAGADDITRQDIFDRVMGRQGYERLGRICDAIGVSKEQLNDVGFYRAHITKSASGFVTAPHPKAAL